MEPQSLFWVRMSVKCNMTKATSATHQTSCSGSVLPPPIRCVNHKWVLSWTYWILIAACLDIKSGWIRSEVFTITCLYLPQLLNKFSFCQFCAIADAVCYTDRRTWWKLLGLWNHACILWHFVTCKVTGDNLCFPCHPSHLEFSTSKLHKRAKGLNGHLMWFLIDPITYKSQMLNILVKRLNYLQLMQEEDSPLVIDIVRQEHRQPHKYFVI